MYWLDLEQDFRQLLSLCNFSMAIKNFINIFNEKSDNIAIIHNQNKYKYKDLFDRIKKYENSVSLKQCATGEIIAINSDFNFTSISLIFFLIIRSCIILPIYNKKNNEKEKFLNISQANKVINIDKDQNILIENLKNDSKNNLIKKLRSDKSPGLILFSSGSSGSPKAAVHNFNNLLLKFHKIRPPLTAINFLLFDHWGGLNTMFHILSNGGKLVIINDRTPEIIAKAIEDNKANLLPASPTFLNLLILSDIHKKYNLKSLEIISYGTEPMPETTLLKLKSIFPNVKLQQTYGLIEVGVLRSKSESDNSLWVKVGGEGYKIRIVDGLLEIKAISAMLGYLNAPNPFTKDGWYKTGDKVLEKKGYIKILGRKSEVINVGGEKVYPQEIENEILSIENVKDVSVFSEKNAFIGNIICANISLKKPEDKSIFKEKMIDYLSNRISKYKIPVKVNFMIDVGHTSRFKKKRN